MCHFSMCSAQCSVLTHLECIFTMKRKMQCDNAARNKHVDFAGPHPLIVLSVANSTGKTIFFSSNLDQIKFIISLHVVP